MKLLPLLVLVLGLTACGSSSSNSSTSSGAPSSAPTSPSSASTPASGGETVSVSMKNVAFVPTSITAKVGQTVVWTNDDTPPHNVVYSGGPKFTSSSTINPGGTFKLKLTQAGTIHYVCTIHPNMTGTITVTK